MNTHHVPIITIDGPSGTGKGTISLMLAKTLKWHYLDSGAIYRVLAYAVNQNGLNLNNIPGLIELARTLGLKFKISHDNQSIVYLNDMDVTDEIRQEACGQLASKLASIHEVRLALLERQREFANRPGLVTDGRDMGTVVFPQAELKVFLDASSEERALRRYKQLKDKKIDVSFADVVDELNQRDERDTNRAHAPLKPATDAVVIDTTRLNIVQVFDNVLHLARKLNF